MENATAYHAGEIAIQERAGVRLQAERGQRMIRDFMPDQHRDFFAMLPFLLVGYLDAAGQPWASMLVGEPGFATSPDPRHLRIALRALPHHPRPVVGDALGILGIQPETRRRNRMNGRVVAVADDGGFTVQVQQSFGNCPQYIQPRQARPVIRPILPQHVEGSILSAEAAALIDRSDTLFIASAATGAASRAVGDPSQGVDVSHRGGLPGFVLRQDDALLIPDYAGNNLFNTFGNLLLEPRAGLLFFDPVGGDMLQLHGMAEILWDGPVVERLPQARRAMRFRITGGLWLPAAIPLQFSLPVP